MNFTNIQPVTINKQKLKIKKIVNTSIDDYFEMLKGFIDVNKSLKKQNRKLEKQNKELQDLLELNKIKSSLKSNKGSVKRVTEAVVYAKKNHYQRKGEEKFLFFTDIEKLLEIATGHKVSLHEEQFKKNNKYSV